MRFKLYEDNRIKSNRSFFPDNSESSGVSEPIETNVPEEIQSVSKEIGRKLYVNYCWYGSNNTEGKSGVGQYTFKYNQRGTWQMIGSNEDDFVTGATQMLYINIYANPNHGILEYPRLNIYISFDSYKKDAAIRISSSYVTWSDNIKLETLDKNPVPAFTPATATADTYIAGQMLTYLINWFYDERPEYVDKLIQDFMEKQKNEI